MNYIKELPSRSSAPFQILEDNNYKWMFLDSNYTPGPPHDTGYISYRQFIVHAIWAYIHLPESIEQKKDIKEVFEDFTHSCLSKEITPFDCRDFLQVIFCLHDSNDKNYDILILDKTKNPVLNDQKGCYPIHIKNHDRFKALQISLEDIKKKLDDLIPILKEHEKWNKDLEIKLDQRYSCYNPIK